MSAVKGRGRVGGVGDINLQRIFRALITCPDSRTVSVACADDDGFRLMRCGCFSQNPSSPCHGQRVGRRESLSLCFAFFSTSACLRMIPHSFFHVHLGRQASLFLGLQFATRASCGVSKGSSYDIEAVNILRGVFLTWSIYSLSGISLSLTWSIYTLGGIFLTWSI